jgi:hypothetical protein
MKTGGGGGVEITLATITYITEWHATDNYNYHFLEKITCFAFRLLTLISLLFENSSDTEYKTITSRKNVLIAISTFLLQGLQLSRCKSINQPIMQINVIQCAKPPTLLQHCPHLPVEKSMKSPQPE